MLINLVIQPEQGWLKTAARFCARRHLERVNVRCCNPQVDVCQAPRVCGTGWHGQSERFWMLPIRECPLLPKQTCEMASETSENLESGRKFFFFAMYLSVSAPSELGHNGHRFRRSRNSLLRTRAGLAVIIDGHRYVPNCSSPETSRRFLFFLKLHFLFQILCNNISTSILRLTQVVYTYPPSCSCSTFLPRVSPEHTSNTILV